MIRFWLHDWLSWMAHSPRSGRRFAERRRSRLHVEMLEGRCLPSTVTNLLDAGDGSLRQAIIDTPMGGIVDFDPSLSGAITLSGTLAVTKDLTIAGPGAAVITLDGNHSGSVFNVASGWTVAISGLTIANGERAGFNEAGGGIYNNGTLTLTGVSVQNNRVFGSTISGQAHGGGIYNNNTLIISDSTFSGNFASGLGSSGGGAIYNFGMLTITDSHFAGNGAGGDGGGAIENGLTMTLSGCTFVNNIASGSAPGGAIVSYGNATLADSTFSGNSAGVGGAIGYIRTPSLTDCTISGNSAAIHGGGLSIVETEIGGSATLRNTLIALNLAPSSPDVNGSLHSQGHNLIGNGTGGSGYVGTDLHGTAGSPIDPLLGPLQDNGGPTLTMALLAGSRALNAGDSAQLGVADQRGVVRSGGVNIGAYQASASAFVLTDLPNSTTAGTPLDVTITAVDPFGQTALGYRGTATFSTSDTNPAVLLPANYPFTAGDNGSHTFPAGVTLVTAGSQTVTATDTATSAIAGSATVAVNPAAADHLTFLQQPTDTVAGQTMSPVIVEVVDAFGNVVTGDNSDSITLSIGNNPAGGTLSGTLTVTVVNGVATFSDLSIDLFGDGYTLHATTTGLTDTDSVAFSITA
jgi:hypothetical protein